MVIEDDDELVAADTADTVGRTDDRLEKADGLSKDLVAGRVAESVVVLLEVVDVEEEQRDGVAVAAGAVENHRQEAIEVATVVGAGEIVAEGRLSELGVLLTDGKPEPEPPGMRGETRGVERAAGERAEAVGPVLDGHGNGERLGGGILGVGKDDIGRAGDAGDP